MAIVKTPYPSTIGGFNAYVREFITDSEGFRSRVYFDTPAHQVLTIGYGFALATGSSPANLTLRDNITEAFLYAGITITQEQIDYLGELVSLVNSGSYSTASTSLADHNSVDDPDGSGPLTTGILANLSISESQGQLLFDYR